MKESHHIIIIITLYCIVLYYITAVVEFSLPAFSSLPSTSNFIFYSPVEMFSFSVPSLFSHFFRIVLPRWDLDFQDKLVREFKTERETTN